MEKQYWQGQSLGIKYLSEKQLRHLLRTIIKKHPMYDCLFNMIYEYGLRGSEAITLKITDINQEQKQIMITRVKRKDNFRTRPYAISPELMIRLNRWLRKRKKHRAIADGNEYLFLSNKSKYREDHLSLPQLEWIFKKYAKEAGIEKQLQHPHVLRHSCGIQLARLGMNAFDIQERLGHASVISTQVYVVLAGEDQVVREKKVAEALRL